jgi:glycosyltransferase involved in cell wall biosynthesis
VKVLYVSPYPPAHDGIGAYTHLLAEASRGQGHDVRVVVPRLTSHASPDVIGALPSRGRKSLKLLETTTKWDPDVVHVQFAIAAFGARTMPLIRWLNTLRRELAVPVIGTLHEVTRDIALLGAAGRELYRWIVARFAYAIVHTRTAYNTLIDRLGVPEAKAVVIPHPSARPPVGTSTPEELRRRFSLGHARILLAFGFIHIDKGLDDLVSALSILRQAGTVPLDDVRIVIAGAVRSRHGLFRAFEACDRLYLARVLRDARRRSVERYLILTGYVPDGEIAAWFRLAEAAVLPYRRTEQSGVASLANAFEVPVLASTVGGLREQFAGSCWTFPPRDPESLARVLASFLAATRSEQTLIPVPRVSDLASVIKSTFELYEKATSGHAR